MNRTWLTLLLLPALACGCSKSEPPPTSPISLDPAVKVVHARPRTVVRTVEQPGVIGAYERTAIYAKVSGYVQKWSADIGDRVKKGAPLVELPNPKGDFLPGMYAYGSVLIERPDVRALPVAAVTQVGNQTCCYLVVDGKAVRTPIQSGVSDGSWVEVTGKLVRSAGSSEGAWVPFDG